MILFSKCLIFKNCYYIKIIPNTESLKPESVMLMLNKYDIWYQLCPRSAKDGSYRIKLLCSRKVLDSFSRELRNVHRNTLINVYN